jgi:hypothetical protein
MKLPPIWVNIEDPDSSVENDRIIEQKEPEADGSDGNEEQESEQVEFDQPDEQCITA